MNLNEAAEIVRRNSVDFPGPFDRDEDHIARFKLTNTMLEWLDPTPISEEWLVADRWMQNVEEFSKGIYSLEFLAEDDLWLLRKDVNTFIVIIKTLGELRTLLRLLGGEK